MQGHPSSQLYIHMHRVSNIISVSLCQVVRGDWDDGGSDCIGDVDHSDGNTWNNSNLYTIVYTQKCARTKMYTCAVVWRCGDACARSMCVHSAAWFWRSRDNFPHFFLVVWINSLRVLFASRSTNRVYENVLRSEWTCAKINGSGTLQHSPVDIR